MRKDTQHKMDVMEPYDPAYLTNEPYQIPDISSYEKKFLRKVSILENKLRKERVRCEWDAQQECFRVYRTAASGYPIYRYVRVNMEENDYSFGTEKEDLVFDGKVSVVVDAVREWLNQK